MPGYELFGEEERQAILDLFAANNGVLFAHGFLAQRKNVFKVREFEAAIARAAGGRHCQVVSSGSAALLVALRALGVGPGDEVIAPAFTFVATVEAILEAGAVPVLTEIDDTYNMDPADLAARITPRTRLVLPVHMAGTPARMEAILGIARHHRLPVLEDTAQAFGATYRGRWLGTLGDAGIYSFDFGKNITTGEGGAIVTGSQEVFERARALHDHGHDYDASRPRGKDTRRMRGFNYRMTEIQAAIGIVQLAKLGTLLAAQRRNLRALRERLAGIEARFRTVIDEGEIADTLVFAVDSPARAAAIAAHLAARGVATKNLPDALDWHFAGTWHHLLAECEGRWPRTRDLLERSIALPVNAIMSEREIDHTGAVVVEAVQRSSIAA